MGEIAAEMMSKLFKMQKDIKQTAEALEKEIITTGAGRGAVKATMNGQFKLLNLEIDPALAPMNDVKQLSEMIKSVIAEAIEKTQVVSQNKMKSITDNLKIPGL
ncbi:MAG: YbaB/EbfC family nucleoid-associated protein [Candidatus Margulisiibacteriota bacterium]